MTTQAPVGTAPSSSPAQGENDARLGAAIRSLRHARRRTLVDVAAATSLSHPFLSQIERGRARPSMRSLFLIAEALGTTQQALLAEAAPGTAAGEPVQKNPAPAVGTAASGARLLLHKTGVDITEFPDIGTEFEEFFAHSRSEFLYVVTGTVEVETRASEDAGSRFSLLSARDSLSYAGDTLHRFRRASAEPCVVLLVHSGTPDSAPPDERGGHAGGRRMRSVNGAGT
jgi:transcriptional regulator with XRE-family HTH domain